MKTHELHPEDGFLLTLLKFAIEEWGSQNVSLQCPAHWNMHLAHTGIRCEFTTEAVITLKIDCGTHSVTYCTLPSSCTPGFFASIPHGFADLNAGGPLPE
ncbi:MAG: hypothetical protein K2W95_35720 [Candidatus Obscuribacterales bacterium]|nr:hypothetical protein [Candidatus Obscuribacterales bacterium]